MTAPRNNTYEDTGLMLNTFSSPLVVVYRMGGYGLKLLRASEACVFFDAG
jgi:hypothetical protein